MIEKTLDAENATLTRPNPGVKTAETDSGIKGKHPKWRLPRPLHRRRGRRDLRAELFALSFPGIGWESAAPGTRSRDSLPITLFLLPWEPARSGTTFRGWDSAGEPRNVNHLLGACPWTGALGAGRLSTEFSARAAFGIVPLPGKTGSSIACYTPVVVPWDSLPSLAWLHWPRGLYLWVLGSFFGWKGRASLDPSLTSHRCVSDPSPSSLSCPPSLLLHWSFNSVLRLLSTTCSGNLPYLCIQKQVFHLVVFYFFNLKTVLPI